MGIETKTIGQLIDELATTNIKCFMAQEKMMNSKDEKEIAAAGISAQKLNKRRSLLIQAIDTLLGTTDHTTTDKTY